MSNEMGVGNLHFFAISLIIGLLIGFEREHSHPEGVKSIGLRSFILFALLGTIAAVVEHGVLAISISLFVFAAILFRYWSLSEHRKENPQLGMTTEIAAAIVFCLGLMVPQDPMTALILASLLLLILLERKRLHTFSRAKLKSRELEAVGILLTFMLVLPFLPNRTIDPWNLFNPRIFGLLMAMIALIQLGGYIAIRLFGHRLGLGLMGFFGGLISSTTVFASLPNTLSQNSQLTRPVIASAMLSTAGMLVVIGVILFVASPTFFLTTLWPLLAMFLFCCASASLLMYTKKVEAQHHFSYPRNPLNILSILRLSLFMGAVMTLVVLARHYVGTEGISLVSFLSGLFVMPGVTLATALLYLNKTLSLVDARMVLAIAIFASFVSKIFLLWTLTPARFALQVSLWLVGVMFAGGMVFFFVR